MIGLVVIVAGLLPVGGYVFQSGEVWPFSSPR